VIGITENILPAQQMAPAAHIADEDGTGPITDAFEGTQRGTDDYVTISEEARFQAAQDKEDQSGGGENQQNPFSSESLSTEEKQRVEKLKKADERVKAHERAHMAAGGDLVQGAASYEYVEGPDGRQYAVSGEVKIDVSPESDPKDTVEKMQRVKRAALAPADPSGQDRAVAAQASMVESEARTQMLQQQNFESGIGGQSGTSPETTGFPKEDGMISSNLSAMDQYTYEMGRVSEKIASLPHDQSVDLGESAVDMITIKNGFAANVKAISAQLDMEKHLIDIFA